MPAVLTQRGRLQQDSSGLRRRVLLLPHAPGILRHRQEALVADLGLRVDLTVVPASVAERHITDLFNENSLVTQHWDSFQEEFFSASGS